MAFGFVGDAFKAAKNFVLPEMPDTPDYMALAQQQNQANRPDQNNPYAKTGWQKKEFSEPFPGAGASVQEQMAWMARKQAYEANPQMEQQTGFAGPLAGANEALMGQAGQQLGTPMDWSQFGTLGNGDEARQQAIDAAYGQATKRLDPAFAQRESAQATQLSNQGLDPNSAAARAARAEMAANRNDAYGSAMNSAIMQGQAAGDSVFRNNMAARQQMIAEALKQRGQPVQEMQALQGFLSMPGFAPVDYMNPAAMQQQADWNKWSATSNRNADIIKGAWDVKNQAFNAMTGGIGG